MSKGVVEVYRNLTKKCLSIKKAGKVVDWTQEAYLDTLPSQDFVMLTLSQSGLKRWQRTNQKNVMATVKGRSIPPIEYEFNRLAKFSPIVGHWYDSETKEKLTQLPAPVKVTQRGVLYRA
jgi:hypothetical protein